MNVAYYNEHDWFHNSRDVRGKYCIFNLCEIES